MSGPYALEQTIAYAFETLAPTNAAAIGFTAASFKPTANPNTAGTAPMGATRVFLTVETAPVRYRYDGVAPTTAVGHLLNPGDVLVLEGEGNLANFKVIATTATNASIPTTYETG